MSEKPYSLEEALVIGGGAKSEGYKEKAIGSGQIIGFGYSGPPTHYESRKGALVISWQDEEMTLHPASKEGIATALESMGITETKWKP